MSARLVCTICGAKSLPHEPDADSVLAAGFLPESMERDAGSRWLAVHAAVHKVAPGQLLDSDAIAYEHKVQP